MVQTITRHFHRPGTVVQRAMIRVALIGCVILAAAGIGHAGAILVANSSFETLPGGGLPTSCGAGCAFDTNIVPPSWSLSTFGTSFTYGQFQPGPPGNTTFYNSVPDGTTILYLGGGADIFQNVGALVAGLTYTLQVDLGQSKNLVLSPGVQIEILAGATFATATLLNSGTSSPTAGNFATATATYVSPGGDAHAGQNLFVDLHTTGDAFTTQTGFDNVRFSNNATAGVPEPSSLLLILAAVPLAAWKARRLSTQPGKQ